jgi:MoxR-like ATPase
MLSKCLSLSIGGKFKRIQFTPDLLPSDITGINYYNQKENIFVFRPGPVFSNILLADEINRATPRTQSSLLEAMEEKQVTIDGITHALIKPFFVLATQNPIEIHGTFPLPEAQLDRFFMRLNMGYPTSEEGKDIITKFLTKESIPEIESVVTIEEIISCTNAFKDIKVIPEIVEYINKIIEATRSHPKVKLGASPRAAIALCRGAQTCAAILGQEYVTPDNIKYVAVNILSHRILLSGYLSSLNAIENEKIIEEILKSTEVPRDN